MATQEQQLLGELYHLEDSLKHILLKHEMYEEIDSLTNIIKNLEYNIINKVGSWGI